MVATTVFAGNTMIFFLKIYIFVPVPVIHRAANCPENTVVFSVEL